jgi:GntR family transcriptional regulator
MLTKRHVTRAIYQKLRDVLAARIATGEWKPGAALPSEADLAREFRVSPGTARKALKLLEAERLLTRRQGRGTFVTDPASSERALRYSKIYSSNGERMIGKIDVLKVSEAPANEAQRARLQLGAADCACCIQRARLLNGEPFLIEEISMPSLLFPGLAERKDFSSPIASLAQEFGILVGRAEERLCVGEAPPVSAQLLGLAAGASILVLDRVVYAIDGTPVEWRLGHANLTDKYYAARVD